MTDEKSGTEAHDGDECIRPQMLPAEVMQQYVLDRDVDEEQQIINYVNGQAPDEIVKMVERIKTEYVHSEKYEIWDVTTDKDSWWVITNITNLYPKNYLPSADIALSLHIGLMARLSSREGPTLSQFEPLEEIYRRDEQAKDQWDRAIEPEEFQAVGVLLRENLLSLMVALRKFVQFGPDVVQPKGSDFKEWSTVLLDHLCPGDQNKELRSFMKTLSDKTWGLVNWVTHDRKANKSASCIAAHSCSTLIGHYAQLLVRHRTDKADHCPHCSSRNVRSHYDREIAPAGDYYQTCGKCDWSNHPGYADEEEGEWRQSSN